MIPFLRAVKYNSLHWYASLRARMGPLDEQHLLPLGFVVGCGRSGTTVLGRTLSQHPLIRYYFEPHYFWAAVDPVTDVAGFYGARTDARMFLKSEDATGAAAQRFKRVIQRSGKRHRVVVEKTPHNAFRIGYLNALAPRSRFIHIARDGGEVAQSIAEIAQTSRYRVSGRQGMNQWWGIDGQKWNVLAAEGAERTGFRKEISELRTDLQRGAFEWLLTLLEVERWRGVLGERLLEVTYQDLTEQPERTLGRIVDFLGVDRNPAWLKSSAAVMRPAAPKRVPLNLPPAIAHEFNQLQASWGFYTEAHTAPLHASA